MASGLADISENAHLAQELLDGAGFDCPDELSADVAKAISWLTTKFVGRGASSEPTNIKMGSAEISFTRVGEALLFGLRRSEGRLNETLRLLVLSDAWLDTVTRQIVGALTVSPNNQNRLDVARGISVRPRYS
eukprot:2919679-Amphidinium_carterae.1